MKMKLGRKYDLLDTHPLPPHSEIQTNLQKVNICKFLKNPMEALAQLFQTIIFSEQLSKLPKLKTL